MQKSNMNVPYYHTYVPDRESMGQTQLDFYNAWVEEMRQGSFLDIQGNIGYLYVYIEEIFDAIAGDVDIFLERLLDLKKVYGEYSKIDRYLNTLISDCYVANNQFKEALIFSPDDYNLLRNAGKSYSIEDAVRNRRFGVGVYLTDFGKSKIDEIKNEVVSLYKEFESEHSVNIIDDCTSVTPNNNCFLFKFYGSPSQKYVKMTTYWFHEEKFDSYIPDVYRLAENRVRRKYNLPQIGEGWLSETQLYYEIKYVFTDCKVTQHAKLPFLKKQHLDVFIHELNIGLEYQGEQHNRPVDYFGGDTAYSQTLERDERKRKLCEKNGVSLIYVYPNYSLDSVLSAIRDVLIKLGINPSIHAITEVESIEIQNKIDAQYLGKKTKASLTRHVSPQAQKKDKLNAWLKKYSMGTNNYQNEKEFQNHKGTYLQRLEESSDPIDRHYWLSELSLLHYLYRAYSGSIEESIDYGLRDIELYEACMHRYELNDFDSLTTEFRNTLGHNAIPDPKTDILINSFAQVVKRLLITYEKFEQYDLAIDLCYKVIKLGMKDNTTKGGFEGKVTRLQKMKSKN